VCVLGLVHGRIWEATRFASGLVGGTGRRSVVGSGTVSNGLGECNSGPKFISLRFLNWSSAVSRPDEIEESHSKQSPFLLTPCRA
jgi:hypothetical protein